jgi:glutamine cyclotransferase
MQKWLLRWLVCASLCLLVACADGPEPTPTLVPTPEQAPSATATLPPTAVATSTALQPPLQSAIATPPTQRDYEIVRVYPHDPLAFTQGLVYANGRLFEGTGLNGQSTLREVELATGNVLRTRALDAQYFGEGLALVKDKLVQLTWKNQVGVVYDVNTFEPLRTFSYTHEGWGLAYTGQELALSDGTPILRFYDEDKLTEVRQVQVTENGTLVTNLNELEWVNGALLGNIWQTNWIVRIDPQTGVVTERFDLSGLLTEADYAEAQTAGRAIDVLNGIAYDAEGDRLFVTGKLWPKLFEIRLMRR